MMTIHQPLYYAQQEPELRMVLVGKTLVGKSSSGNTILRRRAFLPTVSSASMTSRCQMVMSQFEGQQLAVVDTPGLFDTVLPQDEVKREIGRCISFSAPGPHVFLVVIKVDRFTEEEWKTVNIIKEMFGEEAARYMMVLFTHGDDLEADEVSVDDVIRGSHLSNFVSECGGRFHVFNNRDEDPSQVRDLLKKINLMVQMNGGTYFTNHTFKEAHKAIEEEIERLKRNLIALEVARRQAERDNSFMK